jgi:DNA-binding MarR family transcriptional regulator
MLSLVRKSSIEVYHGEIKGKKEPDQGEMIYQHLRKGRATGGMLAKHFNMQTGTVSARVNKLVQLGLAHREISLNVCPITGRRVHWIYVTPQQASLL